MPPAQNAILAARARGNLTIIAKPNDEKNLRGEDNPCPLGKTSALAGLGLARLLHGSRMRVIQTALERGYLDPMPSPSTRTPQISEISQRARKSGRGSIGTATAQWYMDTVSLVYSVLL